MADKLFGFLQRLGRSFMLPIALLPMAGILYGLGTTFTSELTLSVYHLDHIMGSGTIPYLIFTIIKNVGQVIFNNMAVIFAIGVAIGMSKQEKEVAALSSFIAYIVMNITINVMLATKGLIFADGTLSLDVMTGSITEVCGILSLQTGVFGGIIVGLGVAFLHNRFHTIEFPQIFAFFGGTRFIPILSTVTYTVVGILLFFTWPYVQNTITMCGDFVTGTGYVGTLFFGMMKRALIPFGLHHVWYLPFWQTAVGGTMEVGGRIYEGGQNIFFAQLADPATTHFSSDACRFFSGETIFMIFGLPGAALAMYHCAKPERKKQAGSLLLSAAFTSMLTGITEPVEFAFIFVSPILYIVQVILAGSCYMVAQIFNITIGLTFSGGLLDFLTFGVLQGNDRTNWIMVIPLGIIYFILYYTIFKFFILKFDIKTPGRESSLEENWLFTRKENKKRETEKIPDKENIDDKTGKEKADKDKPHEKKHKEKSDHGKSDKKRLNQEKLSQLIKGLGGKENVEYLDCCATRLRCTVKDESLLNQECLKKAGHSGILIRKRNIQMIFGPQVSVIKSRLEQKLRETGEEETKEPWQEKTNPRWEKEEPLWERDNPWQEEGEPQREKEESWQEIKSPVCGTVIPLCDVDDLVFSSEVLGKGFAIDPEDNKIYSPVEGEIVSVYDTKHAIFIRGDQGAEIMIHVGLDTVKLKGNYMKDMVKNGDHVKSGDLLAVFERERIIEKGFSVITPIVITNSDDYEEISELLCEKASVGDTVMKIKEKLL